MNKLHSIFRELFFFIVLGIFLLTLQGCPDAPLVISNPGLINVAINNFSSNGSANLLSIEIKDKRNNESVKATNNKLTKIFSVTATNPDSKDDINFYFKYQESIKAGQTYSNNPDLSVVILSVKHADIEAKTFYYSCRDLRNLPAVFYCTVNSIDQKNQILDLKYEGTIAVPDGLDDCPDASCSGCPKPGNPTVKGTKYKMVPITGKLTVPYKDI